MSSTAGSSPPSVFHLSLSLAILVHTTFCCPTMSSLQQHIGLPADLMPNICHSVLVMVHLLSFIWVMCPAHSYFAIVTYWTMSVTLVLCLMIVLQILSFGVTFSIFLSMAGWLVSSFFTNAFMRDHVWHPYVIAGKSHWLKTFLLLHSIYISENCHFLVRFLRMWPFFKPAIEVVTFHLSFKHVGSCLSRKISLYFPEILHHAFILIETSCPVLFPTAIVCPRYL